MMSHMQNFIAQWLISLKHYLLMCLLLSSPDRLPYDRNATVLTVFSYFLIGLMLVDEQRSYTMVCMQIALELGMLGLIVYAGLRWKDAMGRYQQTFSALVGINLVITITTLPIYRAVTENQQNIDNLLVYVTLAILIWNLAVLSLILKRAFQISTHLSAMISFNYFVAYQFLVIWLS